MKNNNEIHLSDLTNSLRNTHVKLDLGFLAKLLKNASKSDKPAVNKKFVENIGGKFNYETKKYSVIYYWLNGKRTIPFDKLMKVVELSDYTFPATVYL